MIISKEEIVHKLTKYKHIKNNILEIPKFKLYLILATIFLFIIWIVLYLFRFEYRVYFFILFMLTLGTIFFLSICSSCRKNRKLTKIAKELNLTIFQLKYFIKKFKINDEL